MRIAVKTYLPFFKSLRIIGEESAHQAILARQQSFMSEIPDFLPRFQSSISNVEVIFVTPPEHVADWLKAKSIFANTRLCDDIEISADVEVDVDELRRINPNEIERGFIDSLACVDVSEAVEAALFLSELAWPGGITTLEGLSVAENGTYPVTKKPAFYDLLAPGPEDPQWPELSLVSLSETLAWSKRVGFASEAFASSRIGKALASLSHVVQLGQLREGEVLFRAMQGLEAFYCDGIGDLRRQLSEKSGLWLGKWTDKKNIVGQLYDVRSKFVHGSGAIEYCSHQRDAWSENEGAKQEHAYATTFAVRLLVATLQRCVTSGTTQIKWAYAVEAEANK